MSTVIAFPGTARLPQRRGWPRRRDQGRARPQGADIVILPVVRVERHVSALPGPVPQDESMLRPRRTS